MKVFLKLVASVLVAIGAFLIYAVIHAVLSAGGARPGVAVGLSARAKDIDPRGGEAQDDQRPLELGARASLLLRLGVTLRRTEASFSGNRAIASHLHYTPQTQHN